MHLPRRVRPPLARLLRSLPVRGRWRIAATLNRLFPLESVEALLSDVGLLQLDLGDTYQLELYWAGLQRDDARIIRLMQSTLPPDGVFLDVGANIGIHTLAAAHHVAAGGGAVAAFEPHPKNFQTLTHNIARNGLRNVVAHNVGLAAAPEVRTCQGPAQGNWSLASHGEFSFEVRLLRLDDYLDENPLPRLDLIKIDVEGAEARVLQGGRKTLTRFHPLIVCEMCPAWLRRLNSSAAELLETLEGLGYTVHQLESAGRKILGPGVAAADFAAMGAGEWTNLLAVPRFPPAKSPAFTLAEMDRVKV